MVFITTFALAFFFSFTGSIPPGTLNVSMLQLGLQQKMDAAWRFAFAAAIIEYPYAWVAVRFEGFLTTNDFVADNLQLITAVIMIAFGTMNLWSGYRSAEIINKFQASGFRRGIVLSILNPMALPFWIGVTAYLKSLHWSTLESTWKIQAYLFGVCFGAFSLLIAVAYLAKRLLPDFKENAVIRKVPGLILILLGVYAFVKYLNDF
jgi:threonine/homoserine/homoserine lactone efflux protein